MQPERSPRAAKRWLAAALLVLTASTAVGCAQQMRLLRLSGRGLRMEIIGNREEALRAGREALEIIERLYPADGALRIRITELLARGYEEISDYPRAEAMYRRLLALRQAVQGAEHEDTASTLSDLGDVYYTVMDYRRAEDFYQRCLTIREAVLGPDALATAEVLLRLGSVDIVARDYERAEQKVQRALEIYTARRGPDHLDTANALETLGFLHLWRESYPDAERLLRQALAIEERKLDPYDATLEATLQALAGSALASGRLEEARVLFARALEIYERQRWPTDDSALGWTAHGLSVVSLLLGDLEQARRIGRKADRARLAEMRMMLAFGSERERLLFQRQRDLYHPATALGDGRHIATLVLRYKGVVLDSLLEDRRLARASGDPARSALLGELRSLEQQRFSVARMRTETARAKATALSRRIEEIEKRLGRDDQDGARARRALTIVPEQVQAALGPDTVLVEFLRHSVHPERVEPETHYGAVVLAASGEPRWVPLGEAAALENAVDRYQQALRAAGPAEEIVAALRDLYARLWPPIEAALPAGADRVVVSPDGALYLVSFATLLTPDDSFLAERHALSYVASGRDLLVQSEAGASRQMVIYANPDYSAAVGEEASPAAPDARTAREPDVGSGELRASARLRFDPLPGTEREAERIAGQARAAGWPVRSLQGRNASETELRRTRSPRILHFATHGFFIGEVTPTGRGEGQRGIGGTRPLDPPTPAAPDTPDSIFPLDPMLQSGLALSGAQSTISAWTRGEAPASESDGVVLAGEASVLDLTGTWLVTLSACDSGVGAIRSGEGVLGLRRGFSRAGVQNLLMALWPVADGQTAEIMSDFYAALEGPSATPADALAAVQRDWLRRQRAEAGVAEAVRVAGPFVVSFVGPPSVQ